MLKPFLTWSIPYSQRRPIVGSNRSAKSVGHAVAEERHIIGPGSRLSGNNLVAMLRQMAAQGRGDMIEIGSLASTSAIHPSCGVLRRFALHIEGLP